MVNILSDYCFKKAMKHFSANFVLSVLFVISTYPSTVSADTLSMQRILPDNPVISYSGYVTRELVENQQDPLGKAMRFQRQIGLDGKGYGWDTPAVSITFRTNSPLVVAHLYYSDKHRSNSARNGIGIYKIDEQWESAWTFNTASKKKIRDPEFIEVSLKVPQDTNFHDYTLILPYADSVDFLGVDIRSDAKIQSVKSKNSPRYVAYGDSITQGFTATQINNSYAYLLAEIKGWELINLGIAGRSSNMVAGDLIASLNPDIVTILIGCNDWQGGRPLDSYEKNVRLTLQQIRRKNSKAQIYLITPLWVPERWKPSKAQEDIEAYREVLRHIVADSDDSRLHLIEGPDLIDHSDEYFDRVAVPP